VAPRELDNGISGTRRIYVQTKGFRLLCLSRKRVYKDTRLASRYVALVMSYFEFCWDGLELYWLGFSTVTDSSSEYESERYWPHRNL
jgi:hypothetical protein